MNLEHRYAIDQRDKLIGLAQFDADAVDLYERAIEHTDDDAIARAFGLFRSQHQEHVNALTLAIQQMGWATPEFKVDLKGRLATVGVSLRCLRDPAGALQSVCNAERTHCGMYDTALSWQIDDESVQGLLVAFGEHERSHLAFVQGCMCQGDGASA